MNKNTEKVYRAVLDKAFKQTTNNFSFNVGFNDGDDKLSVSFEDYFEDTLANLQLTSENTKEKSTAYAEAFALHSINLIAQAREIRNRIDEFFTSADNRDWLEENGISDDEKTAICQELKDFISDELKVKGKTKEENDFVEKVNAVFDSGKEKSTEYLTHTVDFVANVNKYLNSDYNAKDALNAAYNDMSFLGGENEITNVISEGISTISESVNKEKIDEYNKEIFANYTAENATKETEIKENVTKENVTKENVTKENEIKENEIKKNEVNAKIFLEHFAADPNKLTLGDKMWADAVYERILFKTDELDDVELTSFMANGEQIISDEEFEKLSNESGMQFSEKHIAMVAKLAEKVASGAEITVKYTGEKPVEVDISDVKTDEIGWENEIYKRLLAQANEPNIDYTSFMVNGEQIISNEELENAKDEKGVISPVKRVEIEEKIAEKVVRGEEISVKSAAEMPIKVNASKITVHAEPERTYKFPELEADEPVKTAPAKTSPTKEAPAKTSPMKEAPAKASPTKEAPAAKGISSQPTIPNRTIVLTKSNQIKPMSFGQFMSQLMKNIVNLIKEAIGLDKDKSKSNEKNANSTRTKTNFNELVKKEAEASGKKLPTEKTYEKTNVKVNEKTLTQKGLTK